MALIRRLSKGEQWWVGLVISCKKLCQRQPAENKKNFKKLLLYQRTWIFNTTTCSPCHFDRKDCKKKSRCRSIWKWKVWRQKSLDRRIVGDTLLFQHIHFADFIIKIRLLRILYVAYPKGLFTICYYLFCTLLTYKTFSML